jgi:hypothetical protein
MQNVDLMDRILVLGESVSGRATDRQDRRQGSKLTVRGAPNPDQMDQVVTHVRSSKQAEQNSYRQDWRHIDPHSTAGEQQAPVVCETADVEVSGTKLFSTQAQRLDEVEQVPA